MSNDLVQEPQGIAFFNVKSGDTHYAKLEPTIAAYINSSDMGINASRGQDFGWKLAPEWVKKVREFRRNTLQMSILTAANGGQKPSTVQVLYHLYGEELRAYSEELEEHENPFEEEYQRQISGSNQKETPKLPAIDDMDDVSDLVDDADLEPSETSATQPVKSLSQQRRETAAKEAKQTQK
jgi:hypothetical protein